jgi:hypothetical protein
MWLNRLSIQAWSVGGAGPPEVLGDRAHRHELACGARGHLRPVVTDGQQQRLAAVIDGGVGEAVLAGIYFVEQASSSSASVNATWTWVLVSSARTSRPRS